MGKPSKYQHAIKAGCPYEAIYGASFHTIKKWSKAGWPLDDVEGTKALIAAQQTQPRGQPPGHEAAQPVLDRADDAPETHEGAPTASLGLATAIDRLEQAAAVAYGEMTAAKTSADKVAATKRYTLLVKEWRDTAKSNPNIEESNKQTLRVADVKQTLNDLFLKLRQDLDTMPNRIAVELVGKDIIGIRLVLQREAEQIITSLYHNKYLAQDS